MAANETKEGKLWVGALVGLIVSLVGIVVTYFLTGLSTQIAQFRSEQYKIFNFADQVIINIKLNAADFRSSCIKHDKKLPVKLKEKYADKGRKLQRNYFRAIHNVGFYYDTGDVFQKAHKFNNWLSKVDFDCENFPSDTQFDQEHNIVFNSFSNYLYGNFLFGLFRPN